MTTKAKRAPKKPAAKKRSRTTVKVSAEKIDLSITVTGDDDAHPLPPLEHRALMLRTCRSNMSSIVHESRNFRWPEKGYVEAPDWSPQPVCGFGLHGLLWGEGAGAALLWDADAKWIVAVVDARDVVHIDQKIKVPRAWVVFTGDRLGATSFIAERAPGRAIVGGTATAGYAGTATAGYAGTATAGDDGILSIRWHDGKRYRVALFYIGENGIKANTPYHLNDRGELVEGRRA